MGSEIQPALISQSLGTRSRARIASIKAGGVEDFVLFDLVSLAPYRL